MIDINELKKAIELSNEGKTEEAELLYQRLLELYVDEPVLLSAAGLFYVSICNYEKAITYLKRACELKETFGTVAAYGIAEYEIGNYSSAVKILEHALKLGENVDVYNKLINSLFELKRYKRAIELADRMNRLYPDNYKSVAHKVKALTQQGNLIEAERVCVEFLKKNPENPSLWYHLGLLKELIYSDENSAIQCYKIAQENGNISSDYNIAVAYQKLCNFSMAEEYYNKFIEKFPLDVEGKVSLGMCKLTQKKFREGYELFYQRDTGLQNDYMKNLWVPGTPLDNDIVIVCDQGFGDNIQFIRYLPFLKSKNLSVAVSKSLKDLFERNYTYAKFIDYSEISTKTQVLRVTDLAYVLDMDFDNIPFSEGYLKAESADICNKKFKLGVCWEAGAAGIRGMINRTINVKCFEPIFALNNIQIYSFQYNDTFKGNERYTQMINLAKNFKSFTDTANALKAMDAVVTVDTSVAHLAGALGVKTFLLLPYSADWRWFRTGDFNNRYTPWYKSVTIFQQNDHISWEKPIYDIISVLNQN